MHQNRYIEAKGETMFPARRRKHPKAVLLAVGALVAAIGVATAGAARIEAGNLIIDYDFAASPMTLPKTHDAPIEFSGYGKIHTRDGLAPPSISQAVAEFDKYGHLETRGLPKCTKARLVATTPAQARKLCPGAIVGTGFGKAVVNFPEQAPIEAGSPITFFNGPQVGGDPSVIVHAHLDVPTPTTYLVPVRIERINKGVYGFRVAADIPPIAGGYGAGTSIRFKIDRDWTFKGKELSYINARCPGSRILRARIEARFRDGSVLFGTVLDRCQIREG
jgi:hypothetical protein